MSLVPYLFLCTLWYLCGHWFWNKTLCGWLRLLPRNWGYRWHVETSEIYASTGMLSKEMGYEISTRQMQHGANNKETVKKIQAFFFSPGVSGWLRLLLVALPGLFCLPSFIYFGGNGLYLIALHFFLGGMPYPISSPMLLGGWGCLAFLVLIHRPVQDTINSEKPYPGLDSIWEIIDKEWGIEEAPGLLLRYSTEDFNIVWSCSFDCNLLCPVC